MQSKDKGYVWFLESLDGVHRAIQGWSDLGEALNAALAVLVDVFACDRAWLLEAHGDTWIPVMERARPEYPGGLELGVQLPLTDAMARRHRRVLQSDSAVQLNAEEIASVVVSDGVARPRAILDVAINPKVGHPWILGLHQCSYARTWNSEEKRLFVEIGHRLADALSALLAYRDVRESEQKLAQAQRVARLGYWERDVETFEVNYSEQTYRIFGLSPDFHTLEPARLAERLHPEDRHIMLEAYEQAITGGPRYDVDYRVLLPDGVVRYVHSEADVTWDADGRPLRMFGTMQDITESRRAAEEQAALRRVATLVARGGTPSAVLGIVAEEAGKLISSDIAMIARYGPGASATGVVGWRRDGKSVALGTDVKLGGRNVASLVFSQGHPARVDSYGAASGEVARWAQGIGIRSSVGVPIRVEGRLWGVMTVSLEREDLLPPDTEDRLLGFTDLAATAIANAEAREELHHVATEQTALRRVATLVARGVAAKVVFTTVAAEVANVLPGVDLALVGRYTPDRCIEFVGGWSGLGEADWVGKTVSIGGHNVTTAVFETGQPARVDHLQDDATAVTAVARESGARSSAGAPINVEGKLWGVMTVAAVQEDQLPPGIEHKLAGFTELVATAIANTQAREELAASRARLVTAADESRRRIVRDLHDGAQHGLVQTIITLNLAQRAQDRGESKQARALFGEALGHAEHANTDLRELAQGILPSVLARGGLAASVEELTERLRLPISVQVARDRFSPEIEASAYFVVAEALTNLAKHSRARSGAVAAWVEDKQLHVDVSDDGVGGARPDGGGLRGLADRVAALGGQVQIDSPPGRGTHLTATLPLD